MTLYHSKGCLDNYRKETALEWIDQSSRIILVDTGYGPPLSVRTCEYLPRLRQDAQVQHHLQWLPNKKGVFERQWQYNLPIGLMKLDATDQINFDEHMEKLLAPEYLSTLPKAFYQTNSTSDDFCKQLLGMLCRLREHTADEKVRSLATGISLHY